MLEHKVLGTGGATDASGLRGDVRYSLLQGAESGEFRIDSGTGAVLTASRLDRETRDQYTLLVAATDQPERSSDALTATAEVHLSRKEQVETLH